MGDIFEEIYICRIYMLYFIYVLAILSINFFGKDIHINWKQKAF